MARWHESGITQLLCWGQGPHNVTGLKLLEDDAVRAKIRARAVYLPFSVTQLLELQTHTIVTSAHVWIQVSQRPQVKTEEKTDMSWRRSGNCSTVICISRLRFDFLFEVKSCLWHERIRTSLPHDIRKRGVSFLRMNDRRLVRRKKLEKKIWSTLFILPDMSQQITWLHVSRRTSLLKVSMNSSTKSVSDRQEQLCHFNYLLTNCECLGRLFCTYTTRNRLDERLLRPRCFQLSQHVSSCSRKKKRVPEAKEAWRRICFSLN